jgi:hypothetical protein
VGAAREAGPTVAAMPSITGTARAGTELNAGTGSWSGTGTVSYAYQWFRCDGTGSGCSAISGATAAAYTLAAADVAETIGLTVTATDTSGSATSDASLVGPIAPGTATLASTVRPAVTGTATAGSTLAVSAGTWTTAPTTMTYAWKRCDTAGRACTAIAGATASTYVATAADLAHRLVVGVTATAGTATQAVLSLASSPIGTAAPSAIGRPTIAGTAKVGQRLTGAPPSGAAAGATLAYQWYRCDTTGAHCNSLHGATAKTYTTVSKDTGKTIGLTVRVTATATATPTYSSLLGPLAPAAAPGVTTVQPAVTGEPTQGQVLTAGSGTWAPTPTALHYAWQRCNANGRICTSIEGAASGAYTPVTADVGHALVALVTATFGSSTETAFSLATGPIQASVLANTVPPAVAGTLRVGQQLSGSLGTWTGAPPIAYHDQWYRCDAGGAHCSSVHGATARTYRLVAADSGHTIGLTVTATDSSGSKPGYASLVGPIGAAAATLVSTAQPKVTGTAILGQPLAVDAGTWSATPTATTDQWERCNANGRLCVPIAGATSSSYVVSAADAGHALLALVSAHAGTVVASAFSVRVSP